MVQVVIESVNFSKNPANTNDPILVSVSCKRLIEEVITPSNTNLAGSYLCGQMILREEILKP